MIENLILDFLDDDDFNQSKISGKTFFNFLDSLDITDILCNPSLKKTFLISDTISLTVKTGNISFNDALKQMIRDIESEDYISSKVEAFKELISDNTEIIDLIKFHLNLHLYFDNIYFEQHSDFMS